MTRISCALLFSLVACATTSRAIPPVEPAKLTSVESTPIPESSPDKWIVDSDGIGYSLEDWQAMPESARTAEYSCFQRDQNGDAQAILCTARHTFHHLTLDNSTRTVPNSTLTGSAAE